MQPREQRERRRPAAIAAPTAITVRRSPSRPWAAQREREDAEVGGDPAELGRRCARPTPTSRSPSAVQAAKAASSAERRPSRRARTGARGQEPDERPEQDDPPDRDPDLAADDGVVAAPLEREVDDEHERQRRAREPGTELDAGCLATEARPRTLGWQAMVERLLTAAHSVKNTSTESDADVARLGLWDPRQAPLRPAKGAAAGGCARDA